MRKALLIPLVILGMISCSKAPVTVPAPAPQAAQIPQPAPAPPVQYQVPVPVYAQAPKKSEPPDWVTNERLPEGQVPAGLVAVGIAAPNPLNDKGYQRNVAISDARVKMAGKIKVKVQYLISRLDQTVSSANTHTISADAQSRITEGISRQLINMDLEGADTIRWWTDPEDHDLYVLLFMPKDRMDSDMSKVTRTVAQGEKQLDRALTKLDKFIDATDAKEAAKDNPSIPIGPPEVVE